MIAVLCVDEESGLLEVARIYLEREGDMQVDTAPSGIHALEMLKNRRYDAIVSDYHMAGVDGIDLLKTLRARGDKTPFILFTGRGREEVVIEALNHGASFYLQKGGNPKSQFAELRHMILQAVQRRRMEVSLQVTQFAVDHASDELFWIDREGRFLAVNHAACRALGYDREELLGMTIADIDPAYSADGWLALLQELAGSGSLVFEGQHRRRDGDIYPVEIMANYLELEGSGYLFAFVRDITERKRSEEAARTSRQQLADIIDFLPDATFVIDRDRRVIAWNKAIERMTGLSPAAILGQGDYAYAVPFYGTRRPILIDLVGQADAEVASQYQSIRRDGDTLFAETFVPSVHGGRGAYIWAKASPLYDQCGNLAGAIETVRDVTEQKKAEEALRESEELFRTLVDSMVDAALIIDWSGTVLFANRAAIQLVGLTSPEEGVGRSVMEFLAPESRGAVARDLDLVSQDRGGFLAEYRILTFDGRIRWVESLGTKIRFRGATADLVSLRDVTERKMAEEALRTSEEKFRAVFHNANDAIVLNELTPEGLPGRFLEVNNLACTRLGYSREEFLEMTPADIGLKEFIDQHPDQLEKLRSGDVITFEITLVSRGGVQVPMEISSHIFSLANRPVILSIARDITERRLNEHVEKKAFEQIEKNIGQLAILGDHIRNPLAVIVALADMDETGHGKQIVEQCAIIDDLITRLDKGWIESENVRNFIRRHYGLS